MYNFFIHEVLMFKGENMIISKYKKIELLLKFIYYIN